MDKKPIGSIPFTDGIVRPAFLVDAGGRQYILDEDGQPLYAGCPVVYSRGPTKDPPIWRSLLPNPLVFDPRIGVAEIHGAPLAWTGIERSQAEFQPVTFELENARYDAVSLVARP